MHNPLNGPAQLPTNPANLTAEEQEVLDHTGAYEGPAIVNLVREMQQPPPAQVHHITTQVHVPGHVHDYDDENLDVLIAFVLALLTFFVSWWIIGANTDMSTWNDVRWAGVVGLSVGFVYLAISNGVRRLAGR